MHEGHCSLDVKFVGGPGVLHSIMNTIDPLISTIKYKFDTPIKITNLEISFIFRGNGVKINTIIGDIKKTDKECKKGVQIDDAVAKQKYLKYKLKYMQLKQSL